MVSRLLNNIRETLTYFQVNYAETSLVSKDFICLRKHAFDTCHLIPYRIYNYMYINNPNLIGSHLMLCYLIVSWCDTTGIPYAFWLTSVYCTEFVYICRVTGTCLNKLTWSWDCWNKHYLLNIGLVENAWLKSCKDFKFEMYRRKIR